jgi:phosphoribosyl 1,2-cyclic phosphodiesterase
VSPVLSVTFHGVRGSTPCSSEATSRYGGNTSCVVLEVAGEPPLVLDLGTGLRRWDGHRGGDGVFEGTALLTHVHWDHVMGLPFFRPIDRPGARLDVFGPTFAGAPLAETFANLMGPPFFPIRPEQLRGDIRFHDVTDGELAVGTAAVTVRSVPHLGPTNGYRVDWGGASVAYVSDHQAPPGCDVVDAGVLELADHVDLLVHDAQFTAADWADKADWGHSTVEYAVLVAREAGAQRLALFHHDPAHDDDLLDSLAEGARRTADRLGVAEVIAAAEGLTVSFGSSAPPV